VGALQLGGGRFGDSAVHLPEHLLQPVRARAGLDDVGPVGEPVEHRPAQTRVREHARPLTKWQIGGDDGSSLLVSFAKYAKEQLGIGACHRQVGQLVEDQQVDAGVAPDDPPELVSVLRLNEFGNERSGAGKAYAVAALCRSDAQGRRKVRLARAGLAQEESARPS
jgi:hypothetical protein